MSASDSAASSPWRRLQKRERVLLLVWIGYVPGVFALAYPMSVMLDSDIPFGIVAAAWMILFVYSAYRVFTFECPRCREHFLSTWWFQMPFARRCVHCGLARGAALDSTVRAS